MASFIMKSSHTSKNFIKLTIILAFTAIIGLSLLYNYYTLFFPIDTVLEFDSAEHLNAVYRLQIGQRPFLDFIQNHPMLFHHFLARMENLLNIDTTRSLAMVARIAIFGHFLLCLFVFCLWISKLVDKRPNGLTWTGILITAWAMLDLYNPSFHLMWDIRPDFICYGQTLLGLFLIYYWMDKFDTQSTAGRIKPLGIALLGGVLIGFGNAIIPKGIPFIAAFILTTALIVLLNHDYEGIRLLIRERASAIFWIITATTLSFLIWAAMDCYLSNVSFEKWMTAIFRLNSRKHILYNNIETNPISTLIKTYSVPLSISMAILTWIAWEIFQLGRNDNSNKRHGAIWLFSIFTIIINMLLPSYSNGITFDYYFIPSIFSIATINVMLLIRIWHFYKKYPIGSTRLDLRRGVILILTGYIVMQTLNTPFYGLSRIPVRSANARQVAGMAPNDYIIDTILPHDFVYLGYPPQIPRKSLNWGYYFMLTRATNFWNDCYTLGLGPDPKEVWKPGFGGNPPDAVTYTSSDEIKGFIFNAKACQGIEVSWLTGAIENNYTLMRTRGATLFVRNDHIPKMELQGWQIIDKYDAGFTTP